MLSTESLTPYKLERLIRNAVDNYCAKNNLQKIPVKYGEVKKESGLEFNIHKPSITLSPYLATRLRKHPPYARVWYMLEAVGHELKHYDQYLELKRKGILMKKEL